MNETTPPRSSSSRTTPRRGRSSPTTSPPTATSRSPPRPRADGLRLLETKFPDLAIVDLGLPGRVGPRGRCAGSARPTAIASAASTRRTPLVVLSGRDGELDRVRGFERGADDYVVQAVLVPGAPRPPGGAAAPRRPPPRGPGGCASASSRSTRRRARQRLRGGGARPLAEGVRAAAHARDRADAGVHEGGAAAPDLGLPRDLGTTRTLDSHACRLRQKLGVHGDRFVVNVWGVGYRLVDGPVWPMTTLAALWAWLGRRGGGAAAALAWRELRRGRELVARACHELRGPLTAAQLALHAVSRRGDLPPRRLARDRPRAAPRRPRARRPRRPRCGGRQAADRAETSTSASCSPDQAATWERDRAGLRLRAADRRRRAGRPRARRPGAARAGGRQPRRQRDRARRRGRSC